MPIDTDVVSVRELSIYAAALERNGFFGPASWYMINAALVQWLAVKLPDVWPS